MRRPKLSTDSSPRRDSWNANDSWMPQLQLQLVSVDTTRWTQRERQSAFWSAAGSSRGPIKLH
jgi:hypothetical protein